MRPFRAFIREFETKLEYHDALNPRLWTGDRLRAEVRQKLLQVAQAWVGYARVPPQLVRDVVITGGNVNFNYTPSSDIDLHVIADRAKLGAGRLVDDFLKSRKKLWSLTHEVKIAGYPVECYVQDPSEKHPADQGVY